LIFGHAYGGMSRRRGEITGLMNELPRFVAHNYRPADRRFFVADPHLLRPAPLKALTTPSASAPVSS
jgi:hypothetical protein